MFVDATTITDIETVRDNRLMEALIFAKTIQKVDLKYLIQSDRRILEDAIRLRPYYHIELARREESIGKSTILWSEKEKEEFDRMFTKKYYSKDKLAI